MTFRILEGDCRAVLATLSSESVQCCVTSPPYFGLRDYGVAGQIGREQTPDEYVIQLVNVFRDVRRILRDDGTLWLNLGDSYAGSGKGGNPPDSPHQKQKTNRGSILPAGLHESARQGGAIGRAWVKAPPGYKQKDLIGIPWMVAFALRSDGWYLRSDIIWHKPNPMPESVTDRPTKAHEYLFLLSKSDRYYYDSGAIREPLSPSAIARLSQPNIENQHGSDRAHAGGKTNGPMKAVVRRSGNKERTYGDDRGRPGSHIGANVPWEDDGTGRNKRTVWTVPTHIFKEAHFATFPPKLIEPCILAGSAGGGVVLDPFSGAGTTGLVCSRLGRDYIGIEINPTYAEMSRRRIRDDAPLFTEDTAA